MNNTQIETNTVKPQTSFLSEDKIYTLLDLEQENSLDTKARAVEIYMSSNQGVGKTEEEKNALYANAQRLFNEYRQALMGTRFKFFLNRKQYNFLTDLLVKKMEYGVDSVFVAIGLTEMLAKMSVGKFHNDSDLNDYDVSITEMTYTYHLISSYKVRGLGKEAYLFSEVLVRIGEISKIINYYDATAKRLVDDISKWIAGFDAQIEKAEEEVIEVK